MSTKEVTAIAIKFMSIWFMMHIILAAPSIVMMSSFDNYRDWEDYESLYLSVLVGAFILIGGGVSYILFRVSNSILKSIPESEEVSESFVSQKFLFQLLGVFFIVGALTSLLSHGITLFITPELHDYLYFAGYIFELIVGLYLLIRPEVWRLWLAKLRGRA